LILTKGDDLFLQVSGYANVIQDYIYLQPVLPASLTISGAFPTFHYQQANALFLGGDLDLKYRLFHALEVSAKASLLRVQNLENGPNFPMIPPNRYEAGLSYNFGNWGRLKGNYIQLIGQYTDQQRLALSVVDYMEIPKAYFLLNANVGGKLKLSKNELNLGVNITNALNTKYRDYMDRFRYFSDALGINIVFKIQYIFNS
jgi:iron complex outermembrane receptor protein